METQNKTKQTGNILVIDLGEGVFEIGLPEGKRYLAFPKTSEMEINDVISYLFNSGVDNLLTSTPEKAIKDLGEDYSPKESKEVVA